MVGGETGIGVDNLIARRDQRQSREEEAGLRAGTDHHHVGGDRHAATRARVRRDQFAKFHQSRGRRVARETFFDGVHSRTRHMFGCAKIRLAEFEMQNLAAFSFHFEGAGKDGIRAFGFQVGDTVGKGMHLIHLEQPFHICADKTGSQDALVGRGKEGEHFVRDNTADLVAAHIVADEVEVRVAGHPIEFVIDRKVDRGAVAKHGHFTRGVEIV